MRIPIHRPPGAIEESAFLAGCTRCDACILACPAHAIVRAPIRFRAAAGTPMIDASEAACAMCADTPCIAACEPGVLRPDVSKRMALAVIQQPACLAYTGSFCSVCIERCPQPGAIERVQGRPRINDQICTGCGVCATVCPAPSAAIVLMPLEHRPEAPPERGEPTGWSLRDPNESTHHA